ncbi:DUF805 domain-containing protein [Asticcacaulis sp. ZE23SCel15]|uniref:DUF805 domain-containing protein n=1 Tax=Asticcacaulis sp. ZE23SCel15 TaxID=3059027 RepID=UPI00265E05C6|nr:DUF805 domain-containing protein [Asticcacaulis sp. ZE23SCel15]WKL56675.1 DUF805 domain-containing protein [Asticcacaulis sp. ZE23SCel15]
MTIVDTLLNPNGRINRATFWSWTLGIAFGLAILLSFFLYMGEAWLDDWRTFTLYPVFTAELEPWVARPRRLMWLLLIPVSWIYFCLTVKRWHDMGLTGWLVVISFVPVIGTALTLMICGLVPGQRHANRYGHPPFVSEPSRYAGYDEALEDMP